MEKEKIIIYYHERFQKRAFRYRAKKKSIEKSILIFQSNPINPKLKTHKLTGQLEGYWSFSVDFHLRIIFRFVGKNTVFFLDIGTHEVYQ